MEDRHQALLIRVELKALTLLPLTSTFNEAARHHSESTWFQTQVTDQKSVREL